MVGFGSGPYLSLIAAAVRLARRDLANPKFSAGARLFLQSKSFEGHPVGVDLRLFADIVGYGGVWDV